MAFRPFLNTKWSVLEMSGKVTNLKHPLLWFSDSPLEKLLHNIAEADCLILIS